MKILVTTIGDFKMAHPNDPTNWHLIPWIILGTVLYYLKKAIPFFLGVLVGLAYMYPWSAKAAVLDCKDISALNDSQVQVIFKSYERGYEDDLGYTLAAISWRESSAGKYRINPKSGDYGVYGINYKTVMRLDDLNYYQAIDVLEQIVFDDDKNAEYALKTLRWNMKHFKGDWRKAIAMYNKGSQWRSGTAYASDIAIKVRQLRTCLPM